MGQGDWSVGVGAGQKLLPVPRHLIAVGVRCLAIVNDAKVARLRADGGEHILAVILFGDEGLCTAFQRQRVATGQRAVFVDIDGVVRASPQALEFYFPENFAAALFNFFKTLSFPPAECLTYNGKSWAKMSSFSFFFCSILGKNLSSFCQIFGDL